MNNKEVMVSKIQYLGFYLLFLAYYFDHWPYFDKYPLSCRITAFILMTMSGACLGYIIAE